MTAGGNDSMLDSSASTAVVGDGRLSVFAHLLEANKRSFFEILRSFDGAKAVVWDPDLIKRFNVIASVAELKRQGINHMYKLDKKSPVPDCAVEHLLFISQPLVAKAELISEMIQLSRPDDHRRNHVLFLPTTNELCLRKLKEANLGDRLSSVKDIPIFFYSRETDVGNMEMTDFLTEVLINENWAPLYTVAKCIDNMQSVLGEPNKTYSKGEWSSKIVEMLRKKHAQDRVARGHCENEGAKVPMIDSLVLIDRWIDPVTPLFTQLTYEGLIDEIYGVIYGTAKFPADRFQGDAASSDGGGSSPFDDKVIALNGANELYAELRDLHINAVGVTLNRRLKAMREEKEDFKRTKDAKSVREIKEFVKRLPELQAAEKSAETHVEIVSLVKETIATLKFSDVARCEQGIITENLDLDKPLETVEDLIAKGESLTKVLKLICLQSLVCDGLKTKVLDQYRRDILQSFGYQHISILINLQRTGLLKEKGAAAPNPGVKQAIPQTYSRASGAKGQPPPSTFDAVRKAFRLLVNDVDDVNANDASYVYSGYCPLTIRLCQYLLRPGWPAIMEQLARLPGPTSITQGKSDSLVGSPPAGGNKKVVLVFFVGGVTFAEISALRYLNSKDEGYSFIVATTHMLTGDVMLKSLERF